MAKSFKKGSKVYSIPAGPTIKWDLTPTIKWDPVYQTLPFKDIDWSDPYKAAASEAAKVYNKKFIYPDSNPPTLNFKSGDLIMIQTPDSPYKNGLGEFLGFCSLDTQCCVKFQCLNCGPQHGEVLWIDKKYTTLVTKTL